jgi:hypothetical protein
MVRLIIQDHIAAVHEFSIASDRLKGTSDSNCGLPQLLSFFPRLMSEANVEFGDGFARRVESPNRSR